jgi:broad specificity phosphatase PhoE
MQISPIVVVANDIPTMVEKLRSLKGNALVVAHGNTIPDLLKALGIETPVNIPENDYTDLFVITMADKPQLLRLHYSK